MKYSSGYTIDTGIIALANTYEFGGSPVTKGACGVDLVLVFRADIVIQKIIEEVANYANQVFNLVFASEIPLTSESSRSETVSIYLRPDRDRLQIGSKASLEVHDVCRVEGIHLVGVHVMCGR